MKFAASLLRHWLALMGCAAFTFLSLYTLVRPQGSAWMLAASTTVAIAFFILAAYLTWADEAAEAEGLRKEIQSLRQQPEITGEALDFRCVGLFGSDITIACRLAICNTRPVRTNLRRIAIDAAQIQPRLAFSPVPIAEESILDHGIGKTIELRMALVLEDDIDPQDTVEVDLTPLKIYAIDGFGNRHPLTVRPGTMLFLDPDISV